MADLKPIGSEKLQGDDKIKRILEIARYQENIPSRINETSRVEFAKQLADGTNYEIVKEKQGYIIKKLVNETLEYIEPMKNRKYYGSYSQVLKRLNLMAGEVNRLTENVEEVSMYNIGEQKKFTLKTPQPPTPEPSVELPTPPAAPEMDSMNSPLDDKSMDTPEGDMDMDMELDTPEGEMDMDMDMDSEPSDSEEVTFKVIQKLTGKLGQKIRLMNDSMGMTSEDIKYVINSLISALDISKLDDEDKEDIMDKFENVEADYEMDDMGSEGEDYDMDADAGDEEMDIEMDGEMGEGMYGSYEESDEDRVKLNLGLGAGNKYQYPNPREDEDIMPTDAMTPEELRYYEKMMGRGDVGEMTPEEEVNSQISRVMDEIFSESKVDKVLTSYFNITESEKKEKKQKLVETKKIAVLSIKKLSETIEQEMAAEFIVRENTGFTLVGKTNKSNLVFENNGEQIRVTTKGEVL